MFNSEMMKNMPYHAYVTFSSIQMTFYGGGALISSSHVITSGANTQGFTSWRIGLGSNRRAQHTTIQTNRGVAHPNYSGANNIRINDIGILFLLQPVTLTVNIFPIFLPPLQTPLQSHPFLNEQGMVLGFAGSTSSGNEGSENLLAAYVRKMPFSDCTTHYANADSKQHFCAHDFESGSNFCLGDQVKSMTNSFSKNNLNVHHRVEL